MRNIKRWTFLFMLICPAGVFANQKDISSLKLKAKEATSDSLRCKLYLEAAKEFSRKNVDSVFYYLDKANEIALKSKQVGAWQIDAMGIVFRNKGNEHFYRNEFVEALDYYKKSVEKYNELAGWKDDKVLKEARIALAKVYVNMGVVNTNIGKFEQSLEAYLNALRAYEAAEDIVGMASCYLGIGNVRTYIKEYETAIENLELGLKYYEKAGNMRGMANCINTIGGIYFEQKKYDLAITQFKKMLKIREEQKDSAGISSAYTNLANVYINVEDYELAITYLRKALTIDEKLGDMYSVAVVQFNIARLYDMMATQNDVGPQLRLFYFGKALDNASSAYQRIKGMNVIPLQNAIAEVLFKVNRSLGNFTEAEQFELMYKRTLDSLRNEESTKAIAEMQTQYETEKQKQQIETLNIKKDRQSLILKFFVVGFAIVLVLTGVLYVVLLQKRKANQLLSEKQNLILSQNSELQQANEEILAQRDEITAQRDMVMSQKEMLEAAHHQLRDSLRYAQSIQAAILPSERVLQQISQNSFVFSRPCELVSGDFFWATTFNEYQIFCVADCTGHGVPGAFMSILGITALNDVVVKHRVTKPSEILGHLRQSVIETLSQNDLEQHHKDGMDMALCVLNTKTRELQFAGAGLPLWLVASNQVAQSFDYSIAPVQGSQYSLYELKGDIMPVGQSPRIQPFRNHTINLQGQQVAIYLVTDGFADQLNPLQSKKFGAARLKSLILNNNYLPMLEQKAILEREFENWQGGSYQIDDVTVVGLYV